MTRPDFLVDYRHDSQSDSAGDYRDAVTASGLSVVQATMLWDRTLARPFLEALR